MIDTGHPRHSEAIDRQLDLVLGTRTLDYIFPTHTEMPHAGNLPHLAARHPEATICGDVRDYHLYYPELSRRLLRSSVGTTLDLGGTVFRFMPALIHDLSNTLWGYDGQTGSLFVSDGFAFAHHHEAGECSLTLEELSEPPTFDEVGFLNNAGLYWTRYVKLEPIFTQIAELFAAEAIHQVLPAHGAVSTRPHEFAETIQTGMQSTRLSPPKIVKTLNG